MARKTQAQMIAEAVALVLAQGNASAGTATGAKAKPAKAAIPATAPFLSCWQASRVKARADGTFTHTNRTSGTAKQYRILDEAEVLACVQENLAAGRVYAIPA